jgi:hypothetical protein
METARDELAAEDPTGEVVAAWQGNELLRAVYAAAGMEAARAALERGETTIAHGGAATTSAGPVGEARPRRPLPG